MFTDIELYKDEKQKFYETIREINSVQDSDTQGKIREANIKFRDDIRKYLPTCLNIINTTYNCKFSLYKIGKDYDANFRVIETNVKKSLADIENDFNYLDSTIDMSKLSGSDKDKLSLAKEILTTYINDPTDPKNNLQERLNYETATTSSIITNVPRMEIVKQEIENSTPSENNFNPYSNQPIDLEQKEEFNKVPENSEFSLDIFNVGGNSDSIIEDKNIIYQEPKIVDNPEAEFSQDIFTAPSNVQDVDSINEIKEDDLIISSED